MDNIIYFDHAATSWPKPQRVVDAIRTAMFEKGGNPGRSGHILSYNAAKAIFECREEVCRLFDTSQPERIIFCSNTTHALNTAIKGLARKNSHILISNLEHNSVIRPVHALASDISNGIRYSMFDALGSNEDILYSFRNALRNDTRLVIVTMASNTCGKILPIKEIASVCRSKNIRVIADGAQSAGILPFDFPSLGVDALCLPGHKALYGPQGTGILICGEYCEPESILEGGNGINSKDRTMGDMLPERLEAGTLNTPGICGLCEGIKYVRSVGIEEIFGKTLLLKDYAEERLMNINGIELYGKDGIKAPVILFNKKGILPEKVAEILSDNKICSRSGFHCAPTAHEALKTGEYGAVRISFGHKNTPKEIEKFLSVIKNI